LEWVLERLKEDRVRDASRTGPVNDGKPIWGGLPIRIPERPMQFSSSSAYTNAEAEIKESPTSAPPSTNEK
jgi:hypothetical protein